MEDRCCDADAMIRRISIAEKIVQRITFIIFAVSVMCFAFTAYDLYSFLHAGTAENEYRNFARLTELNPDIVAWISLDNTNVDHPVVRGEDNYEYLSKDYSGRDYAGGSIFLDAGCARDMTDDYLIIHGHNMAAGAMFGDLGKYLDRDFFENSSSGVLLTPDFRYELTIAGSATVDAYDSDIYYAGNDIDKAGRAKLLEECGLSRDVEFCEGDKMVALSTCSGDMSNDRTVVFCRARCEGDSYAEQ